MPTGEAAYSYLRVGVAPKAQDEGEAVDQTAGDIQTVSMNPLRIGAEYLVGVETTGKVIGIEEVLRSDLRQALGDARDNFNINGKSDAVIRQGMIANLSDPVDPAAVVTVASFRSALWGAVDGKLAYRGDAIRMLTNVATIQKLATLEMGANTSEYITDRYGDDVLRASARMPDSAAGNIATFLMYKPMGMGRAVAPVWAGIAMMRDPYTNSSEGQVKISAYLLCNFDMVRQDAHIRGEFDLA